MNCWVGSDEAMKAKLVVVGGNTSKRVVDLKLPTVVGRSREADLTVAHPSISRRHCEIFEHDGLLLVRDMGSLNGTTIDGRRIEQAPLLPNGQFCIGPVTFQVKYVYEGELDLDAIPVTQYAPEGPDAHSDHPLPEVEYALDDQVPPATAGGHDFSLSDASMSDSLAAAHQDDLLAWADAEGEEDLPAEASHPPARKWAAQKAPVPPKQPPVESLSEPEVIEEAAIEPPELMPEPELVSEPEVIDEPAVVPEPELVPDPEVILDPEPVEETPKGPAEKPAAKAAEKPAQPALTPAGTAQRSSPKGRGEEKQPGKASQKPAPVDADDSAFNYFLEGLQ